MKQAGVSIALALLVGWPHPAAPATVQIDVSALLDLDFVVNDGAGPIDTLQNPVDGPSGNRCFITQSAAEAVAPADPDGLPNDGFFAADARHPDVQLQMSNADDGVNGFQAIDDMVPFSFAVPPDNYTEIHFFMVAAEGFVQTTSQGPKDDESQGKLSPYPAGSYEISYIPQWNIRARFDLCV